MFGRSTRTGVLGGRKRNKNSFLVVMFPKKCVCLFAHVYTCHMARSNLIGGSHA